MKSILAMTVLIAAIGPAAAAELPKEGKYDFSDCSVANRLVRYRIFQDE